MSTAKTKEVQKAERFHSESSEGAEAVLERLCKAAGVSGEFGYAEVLDVSPNTIKTWLRRGEVPLRYLDGFAKEHNVSLEYLRYGRGEIHVEPPTAAIHERGSEPIGGTTQTAQKPEREDDAPGPDWRDVLAPLVDRLHSKGKPYSGAELLDVLDLVIKVLRFDGITDQAEIRNKIEAIL